MLDPIKLSLNQKEEIVRMHKTCRGRKLADKLKSVLMLNQGMSCEEVGRILLLDDDTVRSYQKKYLKYGLIGITTDNYKGGAPRLTAIQIEELDEHLEEYTYTDCKGIKDLIEGWFEEELSVSGVRSLMKRMGYSYKKPKQVPGKQDVKKQEAWVVEYEQAKSDLGPEDGIFFIDGVHPQHNTIASYGWIKRGKEKMLKTNSGRQRMNINGALDIETKEVIYVEGESVNAQTTIELLEKLQEYQPKGRIICIPDNASYYHSILLKEYLAEHSRIEFMYLPTYSPNLNIIERLWLILKKSVLYNTYYPRFADFKAAITRFFEGQVWKEKEFENYLIDKFHIKKTDFAASFVR